MTKAEYLAAMEVALSEFDAASRAEIIMECVKSFSTGEITGKTEQQVIDELGSVEECVETLRELTLAPVNNANTEQHEAPFKAPTDREYARVPKLLVELCADAVVRTADVDCPIVDIRGSRQLVAACVQELNGDVLHVYSEKEGHNGLFNHNLGLGGLSVTVTLPRQMRDVTLKLSGGDCKTEGVRSDFITIATGGGDTTAKDCIANEFISGTGGGDHMLQGIAAKKLTCTSGGGDIKLLDSNILELALKTGGGDMLVSVVNAVTVDMKTGGGDITTKQFAANECKVQTGGGDIEINGEAIGKLLIKTGAGDIDVNCVTLGDTDAITGSGDVSIKSSKCLGARVECAGVKGDISIWYMGERMGYRRDQSLTFGDGSKRYTVKSGWGDVNIKLG